MGSKLAWRDALRSSVQSIDRALDEIARAESQIGPVTDATVVSVNKALSELDDARTKVSAALTTVRSARAVRKGDVE